MKWHDWRPKYWVPRLCSRNTLPCIGDAWGGRTAGLGSAFVRSDDPTSRPCRVFFSTNSCFASPVAGGESGPSFPRVTSCSLYEVQPNGPIRPWSPPAGFLVQDTWSTVWNDTVQTGHSAHTRARTIVGDHRHRRHADMQVSAHVMIIARSIYRKRGTAKQCMCGVQSRSRGMLFSRQRYAEGRYHWMVWDPHRRSLCSECAEAKRTIRTIEARTMEAAPSTMGAKQRDQAGQSGQPLSRLTHVT